MADRVFGPKVSGLTFLGIHIGATTEVFRESGQPMPGALSVVLTSPLGQSATISNVANGQSASVQVTPGISVNATVNNCHTEPSANGSPEMFVFQLTLRGSGSVKIGPFPVPVNVQIDAFDVHIPTDAAQHAALLAAHTS